MNPADGGHFRGLGGASRWERLVLLPAPGPARPQDRPCAEDDCGGSCPGFRYAPPRAIIKFLDSRIPTSVPDSQAFDIAANPPCSSPAPERAQPLSPMTVGLIIEAVPVSAVSPVSPNFRIGRVKILYSGSVPTSPYFPGMASFGSYGFQEVADSGTRRVACLDERDCPSQISLRNGRAARQGYTGPLSFRTGARPAQRRLRNYACAIF